MVINSLPIKGMWGKSKWWGEWMEIACLFLTGPRWKTTKI